MKKLLTFYLVMFSLLFSATAIGQGIFQFWGSLPYGGSNDDGVIFSTKYDGTGFTVKKHFTETTPGYAESYNAPVVYNNKLYSCMSYGGLNSDGVITVFDPANNSLTKLADLYSAGASRCSGSMIVYNNNLYGVSFNGGVDDAGTLFRFDPATNVLTVLCQFGTGSGDYPEGTLTVFNNKFYGVTRGGGSHDSGTLFEFDPVTNTCLIKADFEESSTGQYPEGKLAVYSGKLWGTAGYGGLNNKGTVFSFDLVNGTLLKKADLASVNLENPFGTLTLLNNKLYGAALKGGASIVYGGIFVFDPGTNSCANVFDFTNVTGHYDTELLAFNGKLWSCNAQGTANGEGELFSYDPATDIYQSHYVLTEASGSYGTGTVVLFNNELYGFTAKKGTYNYGSLYSFNLITGVFTPRKFLRGPELRNPSGSLTFFNNKLYGLTTFGGTDARGGIYEIDPVTNGYAEKLGFTNSTGFTYLTGGFSVLNNKLYGSLRKGGTFQGGTLFEYDPASNNFLVKHNFNQATGSDPLSVPLVFNNKLYGNCNYREVSNYGNIYEYNPATETYAEKVVLDEAKGGRPRARMVMNGNKFYGVCSGGGATGGGTVFEYNPVINSYIKKADFSSSTGKIPHGSPVFINNKMYGYCFSDGAVDSGTIYRFDPATNALIKKKDLTQATGDFMLNAPTAFNNKLYGMMNLGLGNNEGGITEYDPETESYVVKKSFTTATGRRAVYNELISIPAPVAPGTAGACMNANFNDVNAGNANEWIPFTDNEGRAVAEINANGNILGRVEVRYYINGGSTRQKNGVYYLDRNITISTQISPVTPVSIRLYIKSSEFLKIRNTPGSGVALPADLAVFKNDDFCATSLTASATKLTSVPGNWGSEYVYSEEVSSFSSFYFAGKMQVLPVNVLSFTGKAEAEKNRLDWKINCTSDIDFTVERSSNSVDFNSIGLVFSAAGDCNLPFAFYDEHPLLKSYYRLKIKETSGLEKYSNVILVNRNEPAGFNLTVIPNPVTGNTATAQLTAKTPTAGQITIADIQGKILLQKKINAAAGINNIPIDATNFSRGLYIVKYEAGGQSVTSKLVKQ